MASSRRRFLMHAAAAGGAVLARPASALAGSAVPGAGASVTAAVETFSPPELLKRHLAKQREGARARAVAPAAPAAPVAAGVQGGPDYGARYRSRRNWGRWGDDDQVGAVNLITPEKRAAAAGLVRTGRTVSLSRVFEPPQHFMQKGSLGGPGGFVVDYLGFIYHGGVVTHIDALCHIWDEDGMWQGRDPDVEVTTQGANFGSITHWSNGIITRGVLLDVPRHRGEPHVTVENPVMGEELEAIASAQGVTVEPGDALLVHSGWQSYTDSASGEALGGPGLHASCAEFIRDHDVALLGWDLMDAGLGASDLAWPVHGVLFHYGVALLDNARLEPIAEACAEEGRHEFLFMLLPLNVARGTGSPANPVAMF